MARTDTVYIVTIFEKRYRDQDESVKLHDNYIVDEVRILRTANKSRLDRLVKLVEHHNCAYSVFTIGLAVTFKGGVYVTTKGRAHHPEVVFDTAELKYKFKHA